MMQKRWVLVFVFALNLPYWAQPDDRVDFKKPICCSVRFVDEKHGWIAGYKGVFHTTDGGETWRRQAATVGSLMGPEPTSLDARNGQILWASSNRALVRCDKGVLVCDAGSSSCAIIQLPAAIDVQMNAISFANERDGWAVGALGSVFATRDGGVSWDTMSRPTANSLRAVFVLSSSEVWAAGENGTVIHTRDGGRMWELEETSNDDLWHVGFIDSKEGWLCGTPVKILRTTDGGTRWTGQSTPLSVGATILSMSFADRGEGWAVGSKFVERAGPYAYEPVILHTVDGGLRWELQPLETKPFALRDRLLDVQALPNGRAWAVGEDGTVLRTVDHGRRWTQVKLPS